MDFEFTQEQEALRKEIRAFIAEHFTDDVKAEIGGESKGLGPLGQAFFMKAFERGWCAYSWPKEYGGQGGSRVTQFVVEEEFHRLGFHRIGGGGTGAPAILKFGTDEQKKEFIPGAILGTIVFAQGYSEPGCGSDLAGIRCKAERRGDTYVINGQKVFTSAAHVATHIFLMVRTDPNSKRQAGLSILLVPIGAPGITVRPLWTIQNDPKAPNRTTYGDPRTNEVFFDDVTVPASCLLGQENDGWNVAQRGLNLDRVGAQRYLMAVGRDEDIVNFAKSDAPVAKRMREDQHARDKLAELWTEAQVCRLMTMRSLSIEERGGQYTYEGSAEKVWSPEHGVRSTEAISQMLGPFAQLLNGSPMAIEDGIYAHNMLGAFQSAVNHGSVQVMRDQIARRGLGMPRPAK